MRWLFVIALVGCLDKPAAPPGHDHEVRARAVVADIDGDGIDDLALIGHDGDPREDAYAFVYWGNQAAPLSETTRVSLRRGDAGYYEPLDVAAFEPVVGDNSQLVVMTAEDPHPAYDDRGRTITLQHVSIDASRQVMVDTPVTKAVQLGGYAGDLPSTFVFERDVGTQGDTEPIFGGDGYAFQQKLGRSGLNDATFVLPSSDEIVGAATAVPVGAFNLEPVLLVTQRNIYLTDGDGPAFPIDSAHVIPIPPAPLHLVRARRVVDSIITLVRDDERSEVTAARFNYHQTDTLTLTAIQVHVDSVPKDMGALNNPDIGSIDMVTIEGTALVIYPKLQVDGAAGMPGLPSEVALPADASYDLLAIGTFDSAREQIYVIDSGDTTRPMLCFFVNSDTQLRPCS